MKLYLALSCLQGQEIISASEELLSLNPYGLQLTSGNKFNKNINYFEWLNENKVKYQTHHNFSFSQSINQDLYEVVEYEEDFYSFNVCVVDSLHPPLYKRFKDYSKKIINQAFYDFLEVTCDNEELLENNDEQLCFEIMYDPKEYPLSDDDSINYIMDLKNPIALDISHLNILNKQGHINKKTLNRLLEYDKIEEIHISDNDGKRDSHHYISKDTYLLKDWVKERYNDNKDIPIILECFMQRMNQEQRQNQIDIIKSCIGANS